VSTGTLPGSHKTTGEPNKGTNARPVSLAGTPPQGEHLLVRKETGFPPYPLQGTGIQPGLSMKRTQVAALLVGALLGLAGVTIAVILSREEGRDAAGRLLEKSRPVAKQARSLSERAAKTAVAQYQTLAPRATEALSAAREKAPLAVNTLGSYLPKFGQNGKTEEVDALS
jgi:hypothetical protein